MGPSARGTDSRSRRLDQGEAGSEERPCEPSGAEAPCFLWGLPARLKSCPSRLWCASCDGGRSPALEFEFVPTGISPSQASAESRKTSFKILCTIKSG